MLAEIVPLWLGTLLLVRLAVDAHERMGAPEWVLAAVPLAFIYVPVLWCRVRGVDSWAYRLSIPALRDTAAWLEALRLAAVASAVIGPPFLVAYHLWQTRLFGAHPGVAWPERPLVLVAYHLFFVAIPEEFFYRGYLQTRLNEAFPRRWTVLGAQLGWGTVIATVLFAFGHSVVRVQWWHFATFFPGLVFAWMRERTGQVLPGAFFHAASNVAVAFLDTYYGLRPPG